VAAVLSGVNWERSGRDGMRRDVTGRDGTSDTLRAHSTEPFNLYEHYGRKGQGRPD
jgi:hypothetical protein